MNEVDYSLEVVFGADYKVRMHILKFVYNVHKSILQQYLLLMMGLNNATSIYSCIWCTVSKEQRLMRTYTRWGYNYMCTCVYACLHNNIHFCRWDMSVPEAVYNSPPPHGKARTLAAMMRNCSYSQPKKHLGSKGRPILQTEPTTLVLDELHLLLRIGDVLLRNVILQANSLDHRVHMTEGRQSDDHLRMLETLVRRCGVSFVISPVCSLIRY